ncbi:hypothetical protein Gotri_013674 [Gossypium trilobum]|uniref:Uncharacterized protein n=1 Tax=Gossypium trilobum TaxID=34281 RepID=A0A7J9DUM7_9ROSI|nr:hypothetical protein [Gossypium trilobum]
MGVPRAAEMMAGGCQVVIRVEFFCILLSAKTFVLAWRGLPVMAYHFLLCFSQINFVARSTVKVLEKPDLLDPRQLQASLEDQFSRVTNIIQKP